MKRKHTQARTDEILSAYLDGELGPKEQARLEARLATDPELRARLEALRRTVALVRGMPLVHAPRNFLLTPSMVEQRRGRPAPRRWLAPALTFATAVSGVLCVVVLVGSLLTTGSGLPAAAPPAPVTGEAVVVEPTHQEEAPAFALAEPQEERTAVMGEAVTEASPETRKERPEEPTGEGIPLSPDIGAAYTKATEPGTPLPSPAFSTPTGTLSPSPAPVADRAGPAEAPSPSRPVTGVEQGTVAAPPPQRTTPPIPWVLTGSLSLLTLGLALASGLAWRARRR